MFGIIASIIDGVLVGLVYGLSAMGLTLIWGVMDVINLTHGTMIVAGMMALYLLTSALGVPPYATLLPVLAGGLGVLEAFRPVLVMEMSPYVHAEQQQDFAALIALLRDAGYSIQDAASWKPLPLEAGELEALIPDGASINVIARPNKRK